MQRCWVEGAAPPPLGEGDGGVPLQSVDPGNLGRVVVLVPRGCNQMLAETGAPTHMFLFGRAGDWGEGRGLL